MISFPKLPKSITALFKCFSGIATQVAYEEPPFIAEHGLECRGFSRGNEVDLESTTFYSSTGNSEDPAVKRVVEIAENRGLNVQNDLIEDGRLKIYITGAGAMDLMFDFADVEKALEAKKEAERQKLPPANLPSDVKWPGSDAPLSEHVQYLIDVREYVSQLSVPKGVAYLQMQHSDAPDIGDKKRPAVLDASYDYRRFDGNGERVGRVLASISLPMFTPLERDVWGDVDCHRAQGLSLENINDSFRVMLEDVGVEILDIGKIGEDRFAATFYIEHQIHLNDYERARAVIDVYVRSGITDADELIEHVKRGDRVRQGMDIPGARVDLNSDGSMRIDVPADYDLGGFNDVGIESAEDFEQTLYDRKAHDARKGYMTIMVPAQSVPEVLKAPIGSNEGFAERSANALGGPIVKFVMEPDALQSDPSICDI